MKYFEASPSDFKEFVDEFKASENYRPPILFAIGGEVRTRNGALASVRYPVVNGLGMNSGTACVLMKVMGVGPRNPPKGVMNFRPTRDDIDEMLKYFLPYWNDEKVHQNIELLRSAREPSSKIVITFIFDDVEPVDVEDSTLKLYALSNRIFRPNELNLSKIFTKLPNVAWDGDVPMDSSDVDDRLMASAFKGGHYAPQLVDKFPLYIHRINAIKMGVRITDQHKVRLGAYLGEGTTLMPGASYVNFNAGTEGQSMIEGRVSSGAFVGKGSDVGGGASILGTLSGGNDVPISIGRNCLLEVNSSLGIPIGDAVIIAAETAIMAGSRVRVILPGHHLNGHVVKARELSGINGVTFRRHDEDGALEVVRTRRNEEFARKLSDGESILNADLHKNQ